MESQTATADRDAEYGLSRLLRQTFDLREGSVGAILHELLRAARLYLGMEVAFVSEFRQNRRVFRCVDQKEGVRLLRVGESDPIDESYCKKVVEGRLPELIADAQELPEAREMAATRELGVGAHMSVPVRLPDGSVYGTFCSFSFHADHSLNERDLSLMRVFSRIVAQLIEQEVEQARDEEEKKQRITTLLDEDGLNMVWQPIVEIGSGRVAGVESLARFPCEPHPGPAEWFDEAASVGLSEKLEAGAIERALHVLEHLPPQMYVSCNASAAAFQHSSVLELLGKAPLDRIVLEITEHDVIEDYGPLAERLAPLRERGLRLAVDDAGSGYASFRHILRLKPDLIKLDMSLTRDIDSDITRRSLAASLVQFAREIDSVLIAEGVETAEELETLTQLGVHKVQGFHLHRPQSLENLLAILSGGA